MKPVLPSNVREFSPHGLMFGLMFAVYSVNTTAELLCEPEERFSASLTRFLKHIKMRKQTSSEWCLLGYCRSLSYCYPPPPPCSSGVATSISLL